MEDVDFESTSCGCLPPQSAGSIAHAADPADESNGCGCPASGELPPLPGGYDAWPAIPPADVSACFDAVQSEGLPTGIDSVAAPLFAQIELPTALDGGDYDAYLGVEPLAEVESVPAADRRAMTYFDLRDVLARRVIPKLLKLWSPPRKPLEVVGTGTGAEEDYFGNGKDGNATVSGTTELTRDMNYHDLVITGTGILKTQGYRVFVSGTLTIQDGGVLGANGAAGANGSGASGGAGGAAGGVRPLLGAGAVGGVGGSSGGTGSSAGAGGAGASELLLPLDTGGIYSPGGGGGGGGYAGSASGATDATAGSPTLGAGGGDGGIGFGSSTSLGGGGGGAGGSVVLVYAREIDLVGYIQALGGAGGNGATDASYCGGGGGGGGGGVIMLFYKAGTGYTQVNVSGGVGGSPSGSAGLSGVAIIHQVDV